ncbi:MAG: hypothetical protein IJP20_04685, partial [Clostridia bacterium]|nr:hypothetical protein [Clostridia bacterium]
MFRPKGIFFKYISTFLLIIVILFAVLTATISVIVDSYGINMMTESLSNAANSAAVYLKNDFSDESYSDFSSYLGQEDKDIRLILDLLCINDSSMLMFITDHDGQLIRFGGSANISIDNEAF